MNFYLLATGTLFLLIFSWLYSVRHKRYHGAPRFVAFECVYILFLLNFRSWFDDPFSVLQIISWILLSFSAYAVIAGYLLLKRKGYPSANVENTSVLVISGIYKYIRHPLYLSVFLLGTGVMLKDPEPLQMALGTVNLIALFFTARIEEKEMIAKFGEEYKTYSNETKMFIPFIF